MSLGYDPHVVSACPNSRTDQTSVGKGNAHVVLQGQVASLSVPQATVFPVAVTLGDYVGAQHPAVNFET